MKQFRSLLLILLVTTAFSANAQTYDLTVAQNGSGDYTTIQAAINAVPAGRITPYKIFIKNGSYREKINIPSNKTFVQLIGESVAKTLVYYDDAAYIAGGTSASASFTINGNDFSAFNITFENRFDYDAGVAAGQSNLQGVAVLVNADRAAFKNCRFLGNQDTLYENKKGYFKNCYIDGIIDFIFGGGASIFDSCTVYPKTRTTGGSSYITAANTPSGQAYGYVFRDSKFIGNPGATSYVLGRPWQNSTGSSIPFAENKVVLVNSILNSNVSPAGWAIWDAGTNTSLITFAEYQSKYFNGTPVDVSGRVSWSQQLNALQAADYSNANVLGGWDPCTVYPGICDPAPTDIAVSNLIGTKGTGTATFKWNLSWGMDQVKFEVFRSLIRTGTYTKIGEVTSPNDTTYNYSYIDNAFPPGQQVYYYLLASKSGYASHNTDTLMLSSKPTINVTSSLGTFQQGGGLPSASQTYTVNGVNLSDNVTIQPPANFEISLNNATWTTSSGSIVLPPTAGILANTTIYARMNAATAPGSFSGNITHSTTNGDNVLVAVNGTSQTAPLTPAAFYRSRATGVLNDPATWETSSDSATWFAASTFPTGAQEENVTIMPGHTVTINVAHVVNGKWTIYGTGTNTGGAILIGSSPGALSFANNSYLVWNRDGGTLPAGTVFSAGSTFALTGTGNGTAAGASQLPTITNTTVFHHFIINAPNIKTNNPNFGGNVNTINGNLIVNSTGVYTAKLRLTNSVSQVINIGGDLVMDPPQGSHATFVLYSTGTDAAGEAVNIGGNLVLNNSYSTNITGTNGTFLTTSTAVTLSSANPSILPGMGVTGTNIAAGSYVVSVSGTSLVLSTNTSGAGTNTPLTFIRATTSLNLTDNNGKNSVTYVKGNVTLNNVTLTCSSTGLGTINLNRADGVPQYYTRVAGSISSSPTWIVSPNAILDMGTSVLPGAVFTLSAGATLRTGNTTGITGSITATTKNFNSAANYVFNGTGIQSTTGNFTATTPTANTVNSFTVNNPLNVTLGNSLAVTNALNFTSGKLALGNNSITAGSISGGSSSSYAITNGTGVLKVNSIGTSTGTVLFPVGPSAAAYNPVMLSNSGTTDNFSVKVGAASLPPGIDVLPYSDSSVNDNWTISEDVAGGSNATINLQWNTADQNTLFNPNYCAIVHSNGTAIDYTGTYDFRTQVSPGVFSQTGTGFTSFSPFGVNSKPGGVVVALNLLSFNARKINSAAYLNWTAANEGIGTQYSVERSMDNISYKSIGMLPANGGSGTNNYNLTDNDPKKGIYYYRLKSIESNGHASYSRVAVLSFDGTKGLSVSPNPSSGPVYADHAGAAKNALILIYSTDGKKAATMQVRENEVHTSLPADLLPGVYFLEFINGSTKERTMFIKK